MAEIKVERCIVEPPFTVMPPYPMSDNWSDAIHFKPWVGRDYETGGELGKRILLIGESHYSAAHYEKHPAVTAFYTRHIMQLYAVDKNALFYAKIRNLVLRGLQRRTDCYRGKTQRQSFWDSIAFYNYVQRFVGTKPKQRPEPEDWKRAQEGFWEVLERLQPAVCIALGKELWNRLPDSCGTEGRSIAKFTDQGVSFKRFTASGHQTLIVHTPHPASYGEFKVKTVVPAVRRLLYIE